MTNKLQLYYINYRYKKFMRIEERCNLSLSWLGGTSHYRG